MSGSKKPMLPGPTLSVGGFLEELATEDVKKRVDIVALFAQFGVNLTQKGRSHMGRCPWHEDRSPSLSVDREKGLYNCFACGEAGDAVSLVRKMKGLGFGDAVSFLKSQNGHLSFAPSAHESRQEATEPEAVDVPAGQETELSLDDLSDHWTGVLGASIEGQKYLESRGLTDKKVWRQYRIGYSDGSLPAKLSGVQKEACKKKGILSSKGNEVFARTIIVPLLDEDHKVVSLYGRAVTASAPIPHRYLAGPRTGLVNGKALTVYPEGIILTESIIDALSLAQVGIQNVLASYGTGGVSEQFIERLVQARVAEVVIAFDADEAGRTAAGKIAKRLGEAGIRVRTIEPAGAKDWNELLVAGMLTKEGIQSQIEAARLSEEGPAQAAEQVLIQKEGVKHRILIADRTYLALGVKELFATSLRINLRIDSPSGRYLDNVDLYSARSRGAYAAGASAVTGTDAKRLEKDLLLIVEKLETLRDQVLRSDDEGPEPLCEEDRLLGLELLRDPDIATRIIEDLSACGYVGEQTNKLLVYLAATSRKLSDPLSVMVISESASGKSRLIEAVSDLMPQADVVSMTSLSDQALNYLPEDGLLHKFLVMGEAMHSPVIELQIREMLSAKELSRLVTIKDPKSGLMTSKMVRKKVLVSVALSSTNYAVNPENASRFFIVNTDESEDQTRRIHEQQRQKYSLKQIAAGVTEGREIKRAHHAAQRLLEPYRIVNPFATFLDFPSRLMRARRDHERFLDLIACVAHLRQYQKEVKQVGGEEGKEPVSYIECDIEDYRIAYRIMVGVLPTTLSNFPASAQDFYEQFRKVIRNKAAEDGLEPVEVSVTQRELRERTGVSHDTIKRSLRKLIEYEYLRFAGGLAAPGSRRRYALVSDQDLSIADPTGLPDPREIEEKLQSTYSGAKQGSSGGEA